MATYGREKVAANDAWARAQPWRAPYSADGRNPSEVCRMKVRYLSLAALVALPTLSAAQQPLSYTLQQAASGRAGYERSCAECHLPSLKGSFEAPELAGPNFLTYWAGRSVDELMEVAVAMPPDEEGTLGDDAYASIVAYILEQNGFPAGTAALTITATAALDGATGTPPATTLSPPAIASPAGGAGGSGGRGGTSTYTVVTDFRPVTDAELVDPDPGDWLMYRRTLDGQGYSPLDQIDRDNVDGLRLAWVWAMEDGDSQPTPLVRDGVMYLTNPSNTIQALDARDGTLLWEYRRAFPEGFRGGRSTLRSIAILGDKLFVPTKDAALVALDATTGAIVWRCPGGVGHGLLQNLAQIVCVLQGLHADDGRCHGVVCQKTQGQPNAIAFEQPQSGLTPHGRKLQTGGELGATVIGQGQGQGQLQLQGSREGDVGQLKLQRVFPRRPALGKLNLPQRGQGIGDRGPHALIDADLRTGQALSPEFLLHLPATLRAEEPGLDLPQDLSVLLGEVGEPPPEVVQGLTKNGDASPLHGAQSGAFQFF